MQVVRRITSPNPNTRPIHVPLLPYESPTRPPLKKPTQPPPGAQMYSVCPDAQRECWPGASHVEDLLMVSRFDGVIGVIPVSLMIWTTCYVGTRHLHSMVFRSRISFSFLHWHTFTVFYPCFAYWHAGFCFCVCMKDVKGGLTADMDSEGRLNQMWVECWTSKLEVGLRKFQRQLDCLCEVLDWVVENSVLEMHGFRRMPFFGNKPDR